MVGGGPQAQQAPPTVEEARKFTDDAENRLLDLWIKASAREWVHETFITHDTEQIAAEADQHGQRRRYPNSPPRAAVTTGCSCPKTSRES